MKVMVTGGTGFLGSHCVEALVAAGHAPRLLVRSAQKVERVLKSRGVAVDEVVVGDVADEVSVNEALEGCDAVLHAAATMYGGAEVFASNVAGVRNVVGGAHERGLDPIVTISTIAAVFPPRGPVISCDDPVANLKTTYGRSKAWGERWAREMQEQGAPVVSIYPAGVYGPDDPGPSESSKGLRDALRFGWPITRRGGIAIVDVRDVAKIVAAALQPGRGPRRYMAGGHFLTWTGFADLCDELTGRRARRFPAPEPLLHAVGHTVDFLKRILPFDYPLTHEAILFMTQLAPCDSERTTRELGIGFRPTEETIGESIRSLVETGELPPKLAGRLAG